MDLLTQARFVEQAEKHGLTVDELAQQLKSGQLRIIPSKLYQVMLTDAACNTLKSRGIVAYLRGKNYQAISSDEAFQMFKDESKIADLSEFAVNITEL